MKPSVAAELYALTHRGTPGDLRFYQAACAGAASVLELGAGYGRLLAHLARSVPRLVGLEYDRSLLALARENLRKLPAKQRRAVQLQLGDMRRFELGERFDRVLLPYNGFFCLTTQRDALACLRSVRAALTDDGIFVFDVWNADGFHRRGPSASSDAQPLFAVEQRGQSWTVSEHTRFSSRQGMEVRYDYLPQRAEGRKVSIHVRQRYFHSRELASLLDRAGFRMKARYGDFDGGRFGSRSARLVLSAGRA